MLQMRHFPIVVAFLVSCVLAGCGGGGGGGGNSGGGGGEPTGSLLYRTTWTASSSANSQLVELSDPSGQRVSAPIVLNRGQTTHLFSGLAAGGHFLRSRLYSDPDARGRILGELSAAIEVAGATTFSTIDSQNVSEVRVSPQGAGMDQFQSRPFAATAYATGEVATFLLPGTVSWSAEGAVSVTSSGIVRADQPGQGSVAATYIPTGQTARSSVVVRAFEVVRTKWTVLVYLNAANDLYQFSTLNVNQMERVAANPQVRFVLQWKQSQTQWPQSSFDGTRRYLVRPDATDRVASKFVQDLGFVDMGSPQALADFVQWATTYYPSDRTVLVVWNHGNGWRRRPDDRGRAISYDDETGNAIQIWDLGSALGGHRFDILAWDASLMQMLEVAYEARGNAEFVAGSEESPPGEGYPYDRIFDAFRDAPDAPTRDLAKSFVDGMLEVPEYQSRRITQSVIETARLGDVATALDALAGVLLANRTAMGERDVENEIGGFAWSAVGYANPEQAHDGSDATFAEASPVRLGDGLTAAQAARFLSSVRVNYQGPAGVALQLLNPQTQQWENFRDLVSGNQQFPVGRTAAGVRLTHNLASNDAGRIFELRLNTSANQYARNAAQSYSQSTLRYYRDLIDLCGRLREAPLCPPDVAVAAQNLIGAAQAAIAWEGHNENSPGSRGVSIDYSPSNIFAGGATDYRRLALAQDTRWDEWLSVSP